MRALLSIMLLAGLSGVGCDLAVAEEIPLPRPRPPMAKPPSWVATSWSEPQTFREAAGPDFKSDEVTSEPSACRLRLQKFAAVEAMPRLMGPGSCGGGDIVRLDAVTLAGGQRIEIAPAPYLQCPMAEQLALWVRDEAAPQVAAIGTALTRVDTYDDFSCRGRNRKLSGKVSEHGKANAIDVRGLTFADGRFVMLTDIKVEKSLREELRQSACARFTTVLGPGSDGYHEQHIHLDFAQRRNGYRICQWDVREPPKPLPPLPPSKPPETSQANPLGQVASAPSAAPPEPSPAPPSGIAGAAANKGASETSVTMAAVAVPLPKPRPAYAGKIRHKKRNTSGPFHLPFTLWR